jgi:TP901 family phage tail tape measure protein
MADNATFHAKVSADARQFVEQIQDATEAVRGLISAYGEASKSASQATKDSGTKEAKQAEKSIKDAYALSQKLAKDTSDQNLENIRRENAERAKGAQRDFVQPVSGRGRLEGPVRNDADLKSLITGYRDVSAEQEKQQRAAKQAFAESRQMDSQRSAALRRRAAEEARERRTGYENARTISDQQIALREKESKQFSRSLRAQIQERQALVNAQNKAEQEDIRRTASENRKMMDAMVTGRYALYDVANAYRQIGDAGLRASKALGQTVMAAMQFESAFTSVERALKLDAGSEEFNNVREILIDLSTTIPATFDQITEIATLGAQMGIEAENIKEFTETVARFTTVTGVSVDQAAEKFGRIAALAKVPTSEFENLGAAITFAGFNAVATEKEILNVTESIAAAASKAGFAAKETVGLATALASLGIQPELSRGAVTRIFAQITNAVEGSSGKLREFAQIAGVSTSEAQALFKTDPEAFFNKFVKGLGDVESLTGTFREIGIVNVRDIDVLTRLVQSYDVYEKSIREAGEAYVEGTSLAEMYAKTVDDLEQRIQLLQNSFNALLASLGEVGADVLGGFVDATKVLVDALKDITDNPFAKWMITAGIVVAGVVGAFGMLSYAINIAKAQLLAMQVATIKMTQLNLSGWGFSIKNVTQQLTGQIYAVKDSTGALKLYTVAQMNAAIAAGTFSEKQKAVALAAGKASWAIKGMTVATAAFSALSIIGILTTVGSLLFSIANQMGVFGESTKKLEERMNELGKAGIATAGGLDELRRAIDIDTESTRTEALGELAKAQERVNGLLQLGISGYAEYEKATGTGTAADLEEAKRKGEEYRNLLGRILLQPVGDATPFMEQFLAMSPAMRAVLEGAGFDYVEMVEAAFAEGADGTGAQDYVKATLLEISTGLEAIRAATDRGETVNIDQLGERWQVFQQIAEETGSTAVEVANRFSAFYKTALANAEALDATNSQVDASTAAQTEYAAAMGDTTEELNAQREKIEELAKQLQVYISEMGKVDSANQDAAVSFDSFVEGIAKTGEGILALSKDGQTNMRNWQGYVKAAFTAATADGRGTIGAIEDVITAMVALEAAGQDTAEQWETSRPLFVKSLQDMGGEYLVLAEILETAPNTAAARSSIYSFLVSIWSGARVASQETIDALQKMYAALDPSGDAVAAMIARINAAMGSIRTSAGRAKSALDKLKESVDALFASFNRDIRLGDAFRSLGASLEENGRTFNRFTDAGSKNVKGLQGIITELADQSGGDVQKFANSLVAMREALVRAGVGASGLRYIDDQLRSLGVRGTASARDVNRFFEAITEGGKSAANDLRPLVDVINELGSSIRSGLESRFAYGNAIDDITLGWLDMSDAAKTAQEAIDNARKAIDRANTSIREAQASISGLAADKNKLEYQLQIAIKYGDTLRANQLRADIEKIDADIAKQQENIANSQVEISKSYQDIREQEGRLGVDPTTRQAIERNRALQDMAGRYASVAAWMLATADEGADLNEIIEAQVTEFENNARQLGYTETEVQAVSKALREELIVAMDRVPDNISTTIEADTSGALANINTFVREANNRLAGIKDKVVTVTTVNRQVTVTEPARSSGGGGGVILAARGGLITGPGSSTSDSIAARLSNGEFVVKAAAVQHYGVDFFNALNSMNTRPASFVPSGATSVAGEQMVYLSPEDRQLLRQAIDRPVNLYTDNTVIAKSANAGNQLLAQRGAK